MKLFTKALLALYLLTLLWLVLFKLSFDISAVLLEHQARSLNLVPFTDALQGNLRETIDNIIVFVPLGLLLGVNFRQVSWRRKLAFVFIVSLVTELLQFVLAIGITDITDVITNTSGGLLGLGLYSLSKRYFDTENLDRVIVITTATILILLILFRVLFLRVRY